MSSCAEEKAPGTNSGIPGEAQPNNRAAHFENSSAPNSEAKFNQTDNNKDGGDDQSPPGDELRGNIVDIPALIQQLGSLDDVCFFSPQSLSFINPSPSFILPGRLPFHYCTSLLEPNCSCGESKVLSPHPSVFPFLLISHHPFPFHIVPSPSCSHSPPAIILPCQ